MRNLSFRFGIFLGLTAALTLTQSCSSPSTEQATVSETTAPAQEKPAEKPVIIRAGKAEGNRFFVNRNGDHLFNGAIFQNAHDFKGGYCVVSKMVDGKELRGVINDKGETVIECTHTEYIQDFKNGYFEIKNPKSGFMDSTGKLVIPMEYTGSKAVKDGMVKLEKNYDKWGILKMNGEVFVPFEYDKIGPWRDDMAWVEVKKGRKSTYGFLNKQGELAIPATYSSVTDFDHGVSMVEKNNKMGLINLQNEPVTEMIYDNFKYVVDVVKNEISETGFSNTNQRLVMEEGYIIVQKDGLWGYIDTKGEVIIPCEYSRIDVPKNNRIPVSQGEKRGNYDLSKQEVTWYEKK